MKCKNVFKLIVFGFGVTVLSSCKSDTKTKIHKEIPVHTINAGYDSPRQANAYIGTVTSSVESQLSFQVAGTVKRVYVKQGAVVKQGELLAELDDENLRHSYQSANASLKQARDGYKRLKELYDNGSLPEIKFIEIQTKLEQAESMCAITERNLKDAKLYAPFDGVITARTIENGEMVLPATSQLVISKLRPLEIKIAVPEKEIGSKQIGDKCKITISAVDDMETTATITERNPVANKLSHTYEVKLKFDQDPANVMPGMVCQVAAITEDSNSAIVLPIRTIQIGSDNSRFVWCIENNKAIRKPITIGNLTPMGIEVISGLNRNEKIVTDGAHKLYNGAIVNVL